LSAYENAYSSMNLDALQRVWVLSPNDARSIKSMFDAVREYHAQVQVDNISLSADGRRATVTGRVARSMTPRGGGGRTQATTNNTFILEQRGDNWVIVDVKASGR
jgi:hypothetical protein